MATKKSKSFNIPIGLLNQFSEEWTKNGKSSVSLTLCPKLASHQTDINLVGALDIEASLLEISKSLNKCYVNRFDVICRPESHDHVRVDPFVVQILVQFTLVGNRNVSIRVSLEPRAIIKNYFPISIKIRTPMPHTFSSSNKVSRLGDDMVYDLKPEDCIEVYTPGPSIAISVKPCDNPIAGFPLDWMDGGGWIDLPLVPEFRLPELLLCRFPFAISSNDKRELVGIGGSEFISADGHESLAQRSSKTNEENNSMRTFPTKALPRPGANLLRTFLVTVFNFGIDHTGDILFERARNTSKIGTKRNRKYQQDHLPYGAFACETEGRRLTLLPRGDSPLRILQMTINEIAGFRQSMVSFVSSIYYASSTLLICFVALLH